MPKELEEIINKHFGSEKGKALLEEADKIYTSLLPVADNEPKDRKKNIVEGILPFASIYKVLLKTMEKDTAMKHMYEIMEVKTRNGMRKTYETMGKLPIFFPMFRFMFSQGLKGASWEVEWLKNDKENFHYNIKKCLWFDTCEKLGILEMCAIFCRNDEINFTDVSPRLYFRRTEAIGYGGNICDFKFYRHKPD